MRRRRILGLVVPLLGLVACGKGADPTIGGDAAATTAPVAAVASGDPGATTVPGAPAATDVPVATDPATGAPAPTDAPAPTPEGQEGAPAASFAPPDAGTYTFHTTGTSQVRPVQVQPQDVDATSDRRLEHLNDTDVRQTESGEGGTNVTDLRYLPDQVQLLSLVLSAPGVEYRFTADPPVTFARVPPVAGDSWSWELEEDQGRETIVQSSSVRGVEHIEVGGVGIDAPVIDTTLTLSGDLSGTIQLTSWIDPSRRTSVRTHQVVDLRYQTYQITGDTTSDLVSFTPA